MSLVEAAGKLASEIPAQVATNHHSLASPLPCAAIPRRLLFRGQTPFQRWAYAQAVRHFYDCGVRRYSHSTRGTSYAHLLHQADVGLNFLSKSIADAFTGSVMQRKLGDQDHSATNTVASLPCCYNLFVPFAQDLSLASGVLSDLLRQRVLVDHVELGFKPNSLRALPGYDLRGPDESLGDQRGDAGTAADVAVFYRSGAERGVLLVAFKYIEARFSPCGSYNSGDATRRRVVRSLCRSRAFVATVSASRRDERGLALCAHAGHATWNLTRRSAALDWEKIFSLDRCPFSGGAQQLWRPLLLAENVARQRQLEQFGFWVIAPQHNTTLWIDDDGDLFEKLSTRLRADRTASVRRLTIESFCDAIDARLTPSDERRDWWMRAFRDRYLRPPRAHSTAI